MCVGEKKRKNTFPEASAFCMWKEEACETEFQFLNTINKK